MIRLTNSGTDVLSLITTQNGAKAVVCYSDATSTAYSGGRQVTSITSATTTTICSTPGASTVRDIDELNVKNTYAGNHTITIQYDNNGTLYPILTATLAENESINYTHGSGWQALDANGNAKGSVLSTMSSAQLAAIISDETGSGALVFGTSPTLTTPTINTAASVGGTWTAAATWTLPAFTLGGAITGGSQNVSGLGTLGCGAITSSGNLTLNASGPVIYLGQATTLGYVGNSGNTAFTAYYGASHATNANQIKSYGDTHAFLSPASTTYLTVSSSGITTGSGITSLAFSAGNPSLTIGTGALTAGTGTFTSTSNGAVTTPLTIANNGTGAGTGAKLSFYNGAEQGYASLNYDAVVGWRLDLNTSSQVRALVGGSVIGTFSSTGLSVTGNVTLNETIPAGITLNVFNSAETSTTTGANTLLRLASNASGADASIQFTDSVANNAYISGKSGHIYIQPVTAGTVVGDFSSTGLSVTGTIGCSSSPPASASATGTAGTITWDSSYIYVCTATDTWKRVAISTW